MSEAKPPQESPDTSAGADGPVLLVELKKKYRKKQIRRLRKGKGKLARKVEQLLSELQEEGNTRPVVLVVREKRKKKGWGWHL